MINIICPLNCFKNKQVILKVILCENKQCLVSFYFEFCLFGQTYFFYIFIFLFLIMIFIRRFKKAKIINHSSIHSLLSPECKLLPWCCNNFSTFLLRRHWQIYTKNSKCCVKLFLGEMTKCSSVPNWESTCHGKDTVQVQLCEPISVF